MKINLFTTLGCHLCEEAYAMLLELQAVDTEIEIAAIEIADDDALVERYGIRIPVVQTATAEIGWPFTLIELQTFLTENS